MSFPTGYQFSLTIENLNYNIWVYNDRILRNEKPVKFPHKHFHIEFQYIYSGTETILQYPSSLKKQFQSGEIAIIPPNLYHTTFTTEDPVERLVFYLNLEQNTTNDASNHSEIIHICETIQDISSYRDPYISTLMNQYRSLLEQETPCLIQLKGLILLNVILTLFQKKQKAAPKHDKTQATLKSTSQHMTREWLIKEYITGHFRDSNGIEDLSKILYMSERQTRVLIKKTTGKDYKTLIVEQRMEAANILLQTPSLSLEEISQTVGYHSYSGFFLAYTKYYGISPDQARKNITKPDEPT